MPRERVTMRKTREILRLISLRSQSGRDTARTCGVGKSTVDATISPATAAGLSWPLPSDLDDEALERRLYPPAVHPSSRKLSQPDWQALHDELANNKKLSLILLCLRNRTFFSLAEANAAIHERLVLLNNRPFRKLPGCRQSRSEKIDLPAMLPLPAIPYQYAQWKRARVHIDYHVELEGHFYSAPHRLVKEQVELRYTETIVECFYKGNRIASHPRSFVRGIYTTNPEHMPKAHQEFAAWTPGRMIS